MTPPTLRAIGLVKHFGDTVALDEVHLDVERGEVVALLGPSGCGKSTFLRCITLLDQPDEGFVEISGRPFGRETVGQGVVRTQSRRQVDAQRPKIGLVFQQFNLWGHLTALGNVAKPQTVVLRRSRADAEARARVLLGRLALDEHVDKYPHQLSGGQKQRVAIARALAMDPDLLLFDEPTSALDPELVGGVLALLRDIAATGMTMLVVTHEIGFAANVADRIAFMDRGRIREIGPARRIVDAPTDERLKAFLHRSRSHD